MFIFIYFFVFDVLQLKSFIHVFVLGEVVDQKKGLHDLLNHRNISIVNLKDPAPGRWRLQINSEGAHTIRATGLSKIDFLHGFSRQPTASLKETYHRPLKGI